MTPVRLRRSVLGLLPVIAAAVALLLPSQAGAAPGSTAAASQGQCGNTSAAPRISASRTTIGVNETAVVTVTGSSYLLPPHVCGTNVFGGVYLFFGWVAPGGQWGPSFRSSTSTVGLFGETYSYPGEGGGAETRDDGTGTVRLVSFTAGGESGDATPFHMDGSGNWTSNLTVRGATYSFKDVRTGQSHSVDCRVVQCGVYTIGAHGKASRTNEQFTPINFTDASGAPIQPSNPSAGGAGGTTGPGTAAGSPAAGGTATGATGGTGSGSSGATNETPTTAAGGGSVGEAPTTTAPAEVEAATAEADDQAAPLDSQETAAVQEFDDASGGGGSTGMLVGAVVGVLLLAGAGVAIVRRRKSAAMEVAP